MNEENKMHVNSDHDIDQNFSNAEGQVLVSSPPVTTTVVPKKQDAVEKSISIGIDSIPNVLDTKTTTMGYNDIQNYLQIQPQVSGNDVT